MYGKANYNSKKSSPNSVALDPSDVVFVLSFETKKNLANQCLLSLPV